MTIKELITELQDADNQDAQIVFRSPNGEILNADYIATYKYIPALGEVLSYVLLLKKNN